MINIEILRNKEKKIASFSISGHSLYKKRGEDIVCAGVSSIVQTAILGLSEYLSLKLRVIKKDGMLDVNILSHVSGEASAILETMRLGLKEIAKEYPSHINIVED